MSESGNPIPTWVFPNSDGIWYTIIQNGYSVQWSTLGINSNINMSISFWLKINKSHTYFRTLFRLTNNYNECCMPGDRIPYVYVGPGSNPGLYLKNGAYSLIKPNLPLETEKFITIVCNGSNNMYIYIDGILTTPLGGTNYGPFVEANTNAILYIGDPWYVQNGGVLIKDFSIYNFPLTQNNVSTIYNISNTYQMSSLELQCYKNNYPQDLSNMNNIQLRNHWTTIGNNQLRSNKCPSQQTSSGLYNYMGCYNDTSVRSIPTKLSNVSTIDQCATMAEGNNKNIFGVQNNGECWTGIDEQSAYQYGANFNNTLCPSMGGSLTNQVYSRNISFLQEPVQVPYLTNPNFAYKEDFSDILEEEEEKQKKNNWILILIMILIFLILLFFPKLQ